MKGDTPAKLAAGSAWREAKTSGAKTYLAGRPCKRAHADERYTASRECVACAAIKAASAAKKAYDKKYFEANKHQILVRSREYAERTRDARITGARKWANENPDARRAIAKAYKARRRAQETGGDSTAQLRDWEKAAVKVCFWCDADCLDNYQVDHFYPLSRGGRHERQNLVIACPPCNRRKGAKDPHAFAASLGRALRATLAA